MSDLTPMNLESTTPVIPTRLSGRSQLVEMPEHDARRLTGPQGLAHIRLGDALYTLRITRQGKLILTK